jgi:peptidoglycan/xylan/chitin deacetylase (PgdA/CDA1 family)
MKTVCSEMKRQARRMQPVLLPLLLLALALPLRADSDILTSELASSGRGSSWYEDEFGYQILDYNVELSFTLKGAFAQQSGDLSVYQLTNKTGSVHFWGTAYDSFWGDTEHFDFYQSLELAVPSGVLHYRAESNCVAYAGFSLEQTDVVDFQPYHVRFYGADGPTAAFVRLYIDLSWIWLFDDYCDADSINSVHAFMLSFDDGPIPGMTEKVLAGLDTLHAQGHPAKAGFFLVGDGGDNAYYIWFETAPDMGNIRHCQLQHQELLTALAQRHVLGNHSQHHADFGKWDDFGWRSLQEFAEWEIVLCDQELQGLSIPNRPRIFRPPYLQDKPEVFAAARAQNYRVIWAELVGDTWPWARVAGVKERALAKLQNWNWGSGLPCVLGFHDNRPVTQEHLGEIVEYLRNQGYTLVHFNPDLIQDSARNGETEAPNLLRIVRPAGNRINLSWPITSPDEGIVVQMADRLSNPGSGARSDPWLTLTNPPVVANGRNTITVAPTNASGFFRLRATNAPTWR